jgi:hypothetical protein
MQGPDAEAKPVMNGHPEGERWRSLAIAEPTCQRRAADQDSLLSDPSGPVP